MGVRFACHACGRRLNVKSELAGRRGICPACSVRFRIPAHDTQTSTPIDASEAPRPDDSSVPAKSTVQQQRAHDSSIAANAGGSANPNPSPQRTSPPSASSTRPPSSLEDVLGGTSATWYVRPSSGGQFGPADGPTLGQWISEGRVADSAMIWRDGWPEWRTARSVLPQEKGGDPPRVEQNHKSIPAVRTVPAAPANTVPAAADSVADPDKPLRTSGKVLDTNKKKVSRKRVTSSVVLALVFILLLSALIFVVWWS